jgi:formylglycine-generating enzyme required for sulfatase activity
MNTGLTIGQNAIPNPYTPDKPISKDDLFVGRHELFEWVRQMCATTDVQQPAILHAPPHHGKTSLLLQLQYGRLEPGYVGIYIDLATITRDTLTTLMSDISQSAAEQLQRFNLSLPFINRADFVMDPFKAFREKLLLPATVALNEVLHSDGDEGSGQHTKLLFLFDNLQAILSSNATGLPPDLFHTLHQHIVKNHLAVCLFAWEVEESETAVFAQTNSVTLQTIDPLTQEEAISLIRAPNQYTVFGDVATYIAQICANQPYNIQIICHQLYKRHQTYNIHYITVADVKIVQKGLQEKGQFIAPTQTEAFTIEPNANMMQTVQRSRQTRIQQRTPRLATAVLLLILIACLTLSITAVALTITNTAQVAALFGPTATITPTQPPTATINTAALVDEALTATAAVITPSATPTQTASPTATPSVTPTQTATASPSPTPSVYPTLIVRQQDGMPMILMPAGSFTMGTPAEDFRSAPDERPPHQVTLSQFYIDKYEVSVEQYAAFLNRIGAHLNGCSRMDCAHPRSLAGYTTYLLDQDLGEGTIQYFAEAGFADYPINHVSWYGASEYCQSVGSRLPTEAEWEYAARGSEGRIYPWGDQNPNPDRAVFQSESFENVQAVDALPQGATPSGIFGMAGSMWEWTADWYDESYYANSPSENPTGPETGLNRVARGGSWPNNNQAERIRSANRSAFAPDIISAIIGFRCVRSIP